MSIVERKMALLRVLGREIVPTSLEELVEKLGPEYKDRSVRRYLQELVEEGLVKKIGQKRSTKYQAIHQKLEDAPGQESCFSKESAEALEYVNQPLYQRKHTVYNKDWFDSYEPNQTYYIPKDIREDLFKLGVRTSNKDPAGTYAHQIFNRLLIDLSYNSSRLEGNTYSLLDTEKLILSGTGVEGKLDEEKIMILNHKEAIRYLVENAFRLEVKDTTIFTLHYLLSDGLVESKYSGKVRDHWVRITGSTYMPYDDPKKLQTCLENIAKKAAKITDPFEQSFFLLVHLSYLQAFSDVNKRTARLAANIPFIVKNLVPLSFNDLGRQDYMAATIAIYELQDTRPMMDLFAFSYKRTSAAYDATIKAIGFDEVRVRYRAERREIIRKIIEQKMTGPSMITCIEKQAISKIPKEHQEAFKEDIQDDLNLMDAERIVGLGITLEQLQIWKKAYEKGNDGARQ